LKVQQPANSRRRESSLFHGGNSEIPSLFGDRVNLGRARGLKASKMFVSIAGSPIGDEKTQTQRFMAKKPVRKPSAAFMKPVQPNEALAAIVGAKPLPRTELTKKIWAYIKKNGLQDTKVKTQINADDKLGVIFKGKKAVSMFEMTALVSKNLVK
jgi:chromatin remodeling complex protein RSC6